MKSKIEAPWETYGVNEWQGHRGLVYAEKDGFKVIDCEQCGFKHITPIPTVEELEVVYKHDYYSREKPLYLQRHQEDLEWWNLVYDERYEVLEQALPLDRRRILDVGSGPGYFLARGKERGWDVTGIEPSSQAVVHSRKLGVKVLDGFLSDENADELGQFDAIHASEMLEHLPDPKTMLRIMHDLLKPGGIMVLSVPNDFNPLQFAACESELLEQWWVAPPHHINYFDYTSLSTLLSETEFLILCKEGSFPMEAFLLMGIKYVQNDKVGRVAHGYRKELEAKLSTCEMGDLSRRFRYFLAENLIGRTAVIFAERR